MRCMYIHSGIPNLKSLSHSCYKEVGGFLMIRNLQMLQKSNHKEKCHSLENYFEILELELFTV